MFLFSKIQVWRDQREHGQKMGVRHDYQQTTVQTLRIAMRTGTKRTQLFQEGEIAALDPRLARLMQICGIKELPPVHTMPVPLERITVTYEALARPSARFIRSIELVGIRQPPS